MRGFPIIEQARQYSRSKLTSDVIAALIVTAMLIPQSLAYAILAGLPAQYGLYASILPMVIYALLGTSTTLAVGPVAIASIMTFSTLATVVEAGITTYTQGAILLAFLSGAILFLMGLLKLGRITHFLSEAVIAGFITASCLIIALGQVKHILGFDVTGHNFFILLGHIIEGVSRFNQATAIIGASCLVFLIVARKYAVKGLCFFGLSTEMAIHISRMMPIFTVIIATIAVMVFSLEAAGVAIVGDVPAGIIQLSIPLLNIEAIKALIVPAFFIALIGYIESLAVAKKLAEKTQVQKTQHKVNGDQELIALGGANIAAGVAGAFPVAGGFSRSIINYDAGAKTQFAGLYTALLMAICALFLTPYLYYLPIAALAATIIVAVIAFIDLIVFKDAWRFSKSDFIAITITALVTLTLGVELGVMMGAIASILLHLYRTSQPHVAEIGLVPNTQYFKNVKHFNVTLIPNTVALRIDESLIFSNANFLEDYIDDVLESRATIKHIILHCGAVNTIDLSGIYMLMALNRHLSQNDIKLHLSEVKTPIQKLLQQSNFLNNLSGNMYISHMQAYNALA